MNRGIAALPLIVLLSFVLCTAAASWLSFTASSMNSTLIHGLLAREDVDSRVLEPLTQPGITDGFQCWDADSTRGKIELSRGACARLNSDNSLAAQLPILDGTVLGKSFPQFDYNSILFPLSACPSAPIGTPNLALTLSPSAARSPTSCLQTGITTSIRLLENLILTSDTNVSSAAPVVATAGFLDAQASLIVDSDIQIIAGGDLHIRRLYSGQESYAVTLSSATGVVLIEEVDPRLRVRVAAWLGAFLPAGVTLDSQIPLPKLLPAQVLGLSAPR